MRVENDQVLINLSGAFYQACQGLTSGRALTMVYAIVNTMCQMDGISGVRFYFDGERVESPASTISMRGPLMYNGGIVRASHKFQTRLFTRCGFVVKYMHQSGRAL